MAQPADNYCQYPSKRCTAPRTMKLNGEPHRLCEFHRQLANRNQQRLQDRRRMVRRQEALKKRGALNDELNQSLSLEPISGLGDLEAEDLDILLRMLSNDEEVEALFT